MQSSLYCSRIMLQLLIFSAGHNGVKVIDLGTVSESNRERIAFGPLLITVLFLALKKTGFSEIKKFPKNFFKKF